jgi:hypothetical protein
VHSTGGDLAAGVQTAASWEVNAGTMLVGWVASSTVTEPPAVQFLLHTCTVKVPAWPRWMLLAGWVTLMHSSPAGAGLEEVALDDGLGLAELAAGVA